MKRGRGGPFTPEDARQWSLALYPFVILAVTTFLIITNRDIGTDTIGLLIGLLTAGGLQVAVKRNGGRSTNVESNSSTSDGSDVQLPSSKELGNEYRSWSDYFNRWRNGTFYVWRGEVQLVSS